MIAIARGSITEPDKVGPVIDDEKRVVEQLSVHVAQELCAITRIDLLVVHLASLVGDRADPARTTPGAQRPHRRLLRRLHRKVTRTWRSTPRCTDQLVFSD
ncbi:MAG: hypothetical protein QOG59_1290 [Solirubrobacteraceae bacterium]|jgi:hypothetical protein|nr:hypothetical protein [Solirubrobacteraceae bacterium]